MIHWPAVMATLLMMASSAAPGNSIESYQRNPGLAEHGERVRIAHNIFNRLKRATGNLTSATTLAVIDSDREPWAVALADGNIVLSRGALDIAFKEGQTELASARLAFVLGHELAHQNNGDLYHQELRVIRYTPEKLTTLRDIDIDRSHYREILADIAGFIYASIAGFRTDLLIPDASPESDRNFLHYWVGQTGSQKGDSHPTATKRTELLLQRLNDIDIHHFEYGTRLAHFGEFEQAAQLLEVFRRPFESKGPVELLTNLGFTHILRARSMQTDEKRYRFWLPTVLEVDSSFPQVPSMRSFQSTQDNIEQELEKAISLLNSAVSMDPANRGSLINLAIALIIKEAFGTARDTLKKAIRHHPDDKAFRHLLSLAEHADGVNEKVARERLLSAPQDAIAEPHTIFNTARVLIEQGSYEEGQEEFSKLLKVINNLPEAYRKIVCSQLAKSCNAVYESKSDSLASLIQERHALPPGANVTSETLKNWTTKSGGVRESGLSIYHRGEDSILTEDFTVKMAVLGGSSAGLSDVRQLIKLAGTPSSITSLPSAELWSYGPDAVVKIVEDAVDEIWMIDRR